MVVGSGLWLTVLGRRPIKEWLLQSVRIGYNFRISGRANLDRGGRG